MHLDKLATVGQLSAGLAHEIGSPLQILSGRARALAARTDVPADVLRVGRIIAEQSNRITGIVDQLLSFARRRTPHMAEIDLGPPVAEIVDLLESEARRRGVQLEFRCPASLPKVKADANQIQQVAMNLLSNALRATPSGGRVHAALAESVSGSRDGLYEHPSIALSVEDSGCRHPRAAAGADLRALLQHLDELRRHRARSGGGQGDRRRSRRHDRRVVRPQSRHQFRRASARRGRRTQRDLRRMIAERKRTAARFSTTTPGSSTFSARASAERGFEAAGLTSPREALARLQTESFDLVITDIEMPEMRGTELLAAILALKPSQLVLLITAFGSIDLAVASVRAGACDFIAKPFTIEALIFAIERAFRTVSMRREIVRLRTTQPYVESRPLIAREPGDAQGARERTPRGALGQPSCCSPARPAPARARWRATSTTSSARREQPFFHVNCASLPSALIESELFGVRRGAFTDARDDRPGAFVGGRRRHALPRRDRRAGARYRRPSCCTCSRTASVRPLGGTSEVEVKARIIAATNRPLETLLREGQFRPDLYYRMNVIRIEVPPLRERRDDIVPLVDLFLSSACDRQSRSLIGISAAAMRSLVAYQWPGNVRELANLLERAVALSDHDTLLAAGSRLSDRRHRRRSVSRQQRRPQRAARRSGAPLRAPGSRATGRQQSRRRPHPRHQPPHALPHVRPLKKTYTDCTAQTVLADTIRAIRVGCVSDCSRPTPAVDSAHAG